MSYPRILPDVLGGGSRPLDLGRITRTISAALRHALHIRDQGCSFPGCDTPAGWCDGHHITHWADGGATCLENLALLCGHHHAVVHHQGWNITVDNDIPTYHPPPWIDPDRHPRHHHRYTLRQLDIPGGDPPGGG